MARGAANLFSEILLKNQCYSMTDPQYPRLQACRGACGLQRWQRSVAAMKRSEIEVGTQSREYVREQPEQPEQLGERTQTTDNFRYEGQLVGWACFISPTMPIMSIHSICSVV